MALTKIPSELSSTTGIVDNSNATAITIDSNENVGIGTASPSSDISSSSTVLEIADSNVASLALNNTTQSTKFEIASLDVSGGALSIRDNNSERMRVDSSGNMGIGTSSPSVKVDSHDNGVGLRATRLSNTDQYIEMQGGDGAGLSHINANYQMAFKTGNTERMRINSSGHVGIGTSSPANTLDVLGDVYSGAFYRNVDVTSVGPAGSFIQVGARSGSTRTPAAAFGSVLDNPATTGSAIIQTLSGGSLTERMRIDAYGNLMVGTTIASPTNTNSFLYNVSGRAALLNHISGTSSGQQFLGLAYAGGYIGSISQSGTTGVSYNTSSDQRLKENIEDADDAGSKIDAIQVRQYDWKADGSHQDYGMIAQELLEVAPEAVTVPADSEEMMGVDYSKLVPMLVKEIQSLRNRVAQLEE